jgi:NitT/TauT family transport system substrate-binding protein
MKNSILAMFWLIAILSALSAGGGNDAGDRSSRGAAGTGGTAPSTPLKPFKQGHLNPTAYLLAFVSKEEGFFQEEGLNAELTQCSSAAELAAGLESGKLDVAFIGSVPAITFQATRHDLTIFGGAMTNGHGYMIKSELVPPGFKQGDIRVFTGRNVASVKNSLQDYKLLMLLKNAGLTPGADVR